MAREHLSLRDNWQARGNFLGNEAERAFQAAIVSHLDQNFQTDFKPLDLKGIYGTNETGKSYGIIPDYLIRNTETGRAVFVEIKRQAKRGNAHERACKYFTPGILTSARQIANQPDDAIPFWWVFTNGIATSEKYRREITHWFRGVEAHLLLWEDIDDPAVVKRHFDAHIRPLLAD